MEKDVQEKCKPCKVLLDGQEISKFYCPEKNQYLIENKVCEAQVTTGHNHIAAALRNSKEDLECKLCSATLANFSSLYQHVWRSHVPARFCNRCLCYFLQKEDYGKHLKGCISGKKPNVNNVSINACNYCTNSFQRKIDLDRHVINTHSTELVNSNITVFNFTMLNSLKLFTGGNKDGDSFRNLNLFVHCTTCSLDFKLETYFLEHYSICSANPDFVCPFCSMTKYHLKNLADHMNKHLHFNTNVTDCSHCQCTFLTDLNARIHTSIIHNSGIANKNVSFVVKGYKKPKVEMRLPGFQFLDFLNPKFIDAPKVSDSPKGIIKVKKEQPAPQNQSVNSRVIESCELPSYPVKIKLDIKDDIENIIAGLQTKGLLQDTPSMYCGVCRNVFCLETFVMHLIGCVQEVDFSCSFCQTTVGEGANADDRWGHIKLHLISLTPAGVGSGSVCVMCDELFLTEYNMALHAQFVHFL